MSNVSGLFKDLTTVKKARNGRLASWDQRGKNQDYWEIPAGDNLSWRSGRTWMYHTYLDDFFLQKSSSTKYS